MPEWAVCSTLNRGVRVRLTEMLFDQTHEKVREEGEEHSKTFQNILG